MSDHLPDEELIRRLNGCPEAGTRWRHRKTGNVYFCLGGAINEADCEPLVLYARWRRSASGSRR